MSGLAPGSSMNLRDTIDAAGSKFVQHKSGVDGGIQADAKEGDDVVTRVCDGLTHWQDIFPTTAWRVAGSR